jgi:hypothetical protein
MFYHVANSGKADESMTKMDTGPATKPHEQADVVFTGGPKVSSIPGKLSTGFILLTICVLISSCFLFVIYYLLHQFVCFLIQHAFVLF